MDKPVHATGWCGQGDITILCSNNMTEAAWTQPTGLPKDVYMAADGQLYTFEDDAVTCEACLNYEDTSA